jgi:glycosyltransferase involved in cell wall biosynthesis
MTVSLCLMVRNEEEKLAACLQSAADLLDEIIVVDTGSTDRTKEVAASFGAKGRISRTMNCRVACIENISSLNRADVI